MRERVISRLVGGSAQKNYSTSVQSYKKETVNFIQYLLLSDDKKAVKRIWKEGIKTK